eukprot:TRINITY_DN1601_c0_g2_i1.p2 TRINITY_DN1601_c0_g2~~TRINITY_DN1601_c0_g2_i1.p2  ORF type:complete len:112 (+),score=6.95 TRINITY_DN1601_c0_g2_i1:240-575(+)
MQRSSLKDLQVAGSPAIDTVLAIFGSDFVRKMFAASEIGLLPSKAARSCGSVFTITFVCCCVCCTYLAAVHKAVRKSKEPMFQDNLVHCPALQELAGAMSVPFVVAPERAH